ncbi:SDR family NAD(P)-dependent oxidoreductase [Marinobacter sp. JSM 1782161]|uniref:SDR family NAD(P)-dependent oxidoreductase n=1 Tax=Marinobacter sp. JSM 1782161 TaxID=2685906 RepID=UPI0014034FF9|nr:SDR family oxidoreductase [Marinobacter sp. JSM 1782161]
MAEFAHYPSLRERTVLVIGGATGIGAALVEAFAGQGARVGFLDIDESAGRALSERLANSATPPLFVPCDIRDIDALRGAIARVTDAFGPVRVLINNAARDDRHKLEDLSPEDWDQGMAVNLRPHFFSSQAVREAMRDAGGGSIINMSSNSYLLGLDGYPGYVTAKAGIVGLTKGLARELGPENIRVNALLPGWVMTDRQIDLWLTDEAEQELMQQQALKRKIDPADVARLALFLAADDSALITGQSHIIDGGRV